MLQSLMITTPVSTAPLGMPAFLFFAHLM